MATPYPLHPTPYALADRLLLAALAPSPAPEQLAAALAALAPGAPEALLAMARRHGLAPLLWSSLRKLELPAPLAAELRRDYHHTAAANAVLRDELWRLLDTLEAAGVEPVLLKGAALAWRTYSSPAQRPMGDLDLLVAPQQVESAVAALEAAGYEWLDKHARPQAMQQLSGGEVQLARTSAGSRILVELHWWAFAGEWSRHAGLLDDTGLRQRARAALIDQRRVQLLHPHDQLLHLAHHMAVSHQLSDGALRMLVDLDRCVRAEPPSWPELARLARDARLATVLWHTLSLAHALLQTPVPPPVLAALRPAGWRAGALLRLAGPAQIMAGQNLRQGKRRYLLLLLLMDRQRHRLRLISHTLYPDRAWLEARYGTLDHPRRRHLWALLRRGQI
jgi:hypothetical protein